MATINLQPQEVDLNTYQGNSISLPVAWTSGGNPVNMTGGTVKAQIRASQNPYSREWAAFTVAWTNQSQGEFTLSLPASTTGTFTFETAYWDCTYTDSASNVTTLFCGQVSNQQYISN